MVSRTLFRATKSSAHTSLDNFCSVIEPLSSILQIQNARLSFHFTFNDVPNVPSMGHRNTRMSFPFKFNGFTTAPFMVHGNARLSFPFFNGVPTASLLALSTKIQACNSVLFSMVLLRTARLSAPSTEMHACNSILFTIVFLLLDYLHLPRKCTLVIPFYFQSCPYCLITYTFHGNGRLPFPVIFNLVDTARLPAPSTDTGACHSILFSIVLILLDYLHLPRKCTFVIPFYFQRCS